MSLAVCVCLGIWSQINLEAEAAAVSWANWGFSPVIVKDQYCSKTLSGRSRFEMAFNTSDF